MKQWIAFWSLGLIWGSSFLLIKVAVEELGALPLVSMRVTIAGSLMLLIFLVSGRRLPDNRQDMLSLLLVTLFNVIIPFSLITRAEELIDSSLATTLNSTVPLSSLIIAHFALHDERLTPPKIVGLLIGYVGILVLTSRGLSEASTDSLEGTVMMLAATLSYAIATVLLRARLRHLEAVTVAGSTLMLAALFIVPVTLLITPDLPDLTHLETETIFSILVLSILNTVIAYFLSYHLLSQWGARATMVTYVFPPVGITLGAVFLDEPVDARLLLGAALILGGIFAVNYKRQMPQPVPAPSAPAPRV